MKESSLLFANSISNYGIDVIQHLPGRSNPCMSLPRQQLEVVDFMSLRLKLQIVFVDIVQCLSPWLILSLTEDPENMVKYSKHESTTAA